LWLSRNIEHAELVRVEGLDASYEVFEKDKLEALAGLRPRLISDVERMPGARILEQKFSAVQQSVGTPKSRPEAGIKFLVEFVEELKANGTIAQFISQHDVRGLSVAPPA
jgi:polar amino acid transport system substrate-binding protein